MINIRVSVEQTITQKIISLDTALGFLRKVKNIFYQDRTWDILETEFGNLKEFNKIFIWLKDNYIDQKKLDATEILHFVNDHNFPHKTSITVSNTALLET